MFFWIIQNPLLQQQIFEHFKSLDNREFFTKYCFMADVIFSSQKLYIKNSFKLYRKKKLNYS